MRWRLSAFGPQRTFPCVALDVAIRGKADMTFAALMSPFDPKRTSMASLVMLA